MRLKTALCFSDCLNYAGLHENSNDIDKSKKKGKNPRKFPPKSCNHYLHFGSHLSVLLHHQYPAITSPKAGEITHSASMHSITTFTDIHTRS